ncbi:hypothetical protein SH449x_001901 [Pirellulaceae bacterium SH449]
MAATDRRSGQRRLSRIAPPIRQDWECTWLAQVKFTFLAASSFSLLPLINIQHNGSLRERLQISTMGKRQID